MLVRCTRFAVMACALGIGVSAWSADDYNHYLRKAQEQSFFIQNQHHQGVVSLANGVQYRVVNPGVGSPMPSQNDQINLQYSVSYLNGQPVQSMNRAKHLHVAIKNLPPIIGDIVEKMAPGATVQVFVPNRLTAQVVQGLLSKSAETDQAVVLKMKLLGISRA